MVKHFPSTPAPKPFFPYPSVRPLVPVLFTHHQLMIAQHPMNFEPPENLVPHPPPPVAGRTSINVPQMNYKIKIGLSYLRSDLFGYPKIPLGIPHNGKPPWWIEYEKQESEPHKATSRLFYGPACFFVQPHQSVITSKSPPASFRVDPHVHM